METIFKRKPKPSQPVPQADKSEYKQILEKDSIESAKAGEYLLHLFIIETSKINVNTDLNAFISIKALGETKKTRIWKGLGPSSITRWNEHFFFTKRFLSLEDLRDESIEITLMNGNILTKDSRIGTIKRYLFSLIDSNNKFITNQWSIFADPLNDFGVAKGFIRFSLSFTLASEEQKDLEELSLKIPQTPNIEFPPSIHPKNMQMIIKIYNGRKIYGIESTGKSDPVIKVDLGGVKAQVKHIMQTIDPNFYQTLYLRFFEPTLIDRVLLKLYDYNRFSQDTKLGTINISLEDIYKGVYSTPKWLQFYGASKYSKKTDIKKIMNNQPVHSSAFTGELLIAIEINETKKAKIKSEDMNKLEISLSRCRLVTVTFNLQIDIEYIYNLNVEPGKIDMTIDWGTNDHRTTLPSQKLQNKLLIVNRGICLKRTFEVGFTAMSDFSLESEILEQIPDVFVYLTHNSLNVSFYRFKVKDIMMNIFGYDPERTVKMKPDMAVSDLSVDSAGFMKLKIGMKEMPRTAEFSKKVKNYRDFMEKKKVLDQEDIKCNFMPPEDFVSNPAITEEKLFPHLDEKMKYQPIVIIIELFQAKQLICVESDGMPDTYVDFYHFGSNVQSKLIVDSLNPCWNEKLVLKSYRVNGKTPNLVVNLYDRDKNALGQSKDELIGWSEISLPMTSYIEDEDNINFDSPWWRHLTVLGDIKAGQILLRVKWSLLSTFKKNVDYIEKASEPLNFPKCNYNIKATVLGLRALKVKSLFSIKKSQINFDTTVLAEENNLDYKHQISLTSRNTGLDPMFGRSIMRSGNLPENLYLMPSISCEVIDPSFTFFDSHKKIGNFIIDLSIASYLSTVELIAKLEVLKEFRKDVSKIHSDPAENKQTMQNITGIINHLSINMKAQEAYISKEFPDVFVQANLVKEDYKKLGTHTLMSSMLADFQAMPMPMPQMASIEEPIKQKMNEDELKATADLLNEKIAKELTLETNVINPRKENIVFHSSTDTFLPDRQNNRLSAINQPNISVLKNKLSPIALLELFKKQETSSDPIVLTVDAHFKLFDGQKKKYEELGYKDAKNDTRHYRLKVDTDLEQTAYMGADQFNSVGIYRGEKFLKSGAGFFDFIASKLANPYVQSGTFRGKVEMIQEKVFDEITTLNLEHSERKMLGLPTSIEDWGASGLDQLISSDMEIELVVYVIDAVFSINLDFRSANDGYVVLVLNGKKYKGQKVIQDSNDPKFMERFFIPCAIPGCSDLEIQFWDKDVVIDEFIGSTFIDVERRFMDERFKRRTEHPIEYREILTKDSEKAGHTRLWLEFLKKNKDTREFCTIEGIPKTPWKIDPRPPVFLYIRAIVYDTTNVPIIDVTGAADYLVSVTFPLLNKQQKTDIHYRSQDGDGSFNWRFEFGFWVDFNFNFNEAKLSFRVFDKELLQPDKFLCDLEINFEDSIKKVLETDQGKKILGIDKDSEKDGYEIFYKQMTLGKGNKAPEKKKPTLITMSAEVLTKAERENAPAGLGRSSPNENPYLPAPSGRFQWSWNPVKIFEQTFGKTFRKKCGLICIILILVFIFIIFAPILVSSIISGVVNKKIFG